MKKILTAISLVFLCFTISQVAISFGLFETKIEDESDLKIAKWHIFVNNYDLNQEGHTFYVDNISYVDRNGNEVDKFFPGVTGSFLIVIDPKDTEVSFQYHFELDLSDTSFEQIRIDSVEGLNGIQLEKQGNIYSRTMTLNEIESGKKDTIKVTFHWEWDDKYNESDSTLGQSVDSVFKIPIHMSFEQYTN